MKHIDGIYKRGKIKRIDGIYDSKLLSELTDAEILKRLSKTITYLSNSYRTAIPGYDQDDISQEISIIILSKMPKIPKDMLVFDWRFMKFMELCCRRGIRDLWRSHTTQIKGVKYYRDELDRSTPLREEF